MINNFFIFVVSLFLVARGAAVATKASGKLAGSFRLSKYTVGFIVVGIISILPETFIFLNAALKGIPSFGLGVIFGSNVADLTLVLAAVVFIAGRGIKIESKILRLNESYPFLLLMPLVLGLDGRFTRFEGIALMIVGAVFYYQAFRSGASGSERVVRDKTDRLKNLLFLLYGMVMLLVGSHFTVTSATDLAGALRISPILIGMLVVGIGTTMPELFFAQKSARDNEDALAVGDILGTVLADATIVIGLIAIVSPFSFPVRIVYVTGAFMLGASILLLKFMRSGRTLSKREAYYLIVYWLAFVLVEFLINSNFFNDK